MTKFITKFRVKFGPKFENLVDLRRNSDTVVLNEG